MHLHFKAILAVLICLAAPLPALAQQPAAAAPAEAAPIAGAIRDAFDGRTFAASFGQDGRGEAGRDVIHFKDGLMSTAICLQNGFAPAPYLLRTEGKRVYFYAVMHSEARGKNVWSGYVEGDKLEARFDWERSRWYWTVHVGVWFKGNLVGPGDNPPVYHE